MSGGGDWGRIFGGLVDVLGPDDCWMWRGGICNGYGYVRVAGAKRTGAHRASLSLASGAPIPPGAVVMHTCDVKACVNPAHLRVGTQADNMADKVRKGRQARGQKSNKAGLVETKVIEIVRRLAVGESLGTIASAFGISKAAVCDIKRGNSWSWLTGRTA